MAHPPLSPPSSSRPATQPKQSRAALAARSLATPAAKALLVGYVLDLIPSLLKAILRFVTREVKRITALQKRAREERKAAREDREKAGSSSFLSTYAAGKVKTWEDLVAPTLAGLPGLGADMARATAASLSPQGMAAACAAAMLGWGLLDEALSKILLYIAGRPSTSSRTRNQLVHIWSCFIAATLASGTSLMFLQVATLASSNKDGQTASGSRPTIREPYMSPSESFSNLKRSVVSRFSSSHNQKGLSLPTPLAPGGHFLARLTSLSIPGTPKADGSRSPTTSKSTSLGLSEAGRSPASQTSPLATATPQSESSAQLPPSRDEIKKTAQRAAHDASAPRALGKPSPTVDLTLFALVRGLDTLVRAAPLFIGAAASKAGGAKGLQATAATAAATAISPTSSSGPSIIGRQRSRQALGSSIGSGRRLSAAARVAESSIPAAILRGAANQAEGITFVLCCAVIMWSWFYAPERLPPTYVRWITNLCVLRWGSAVLRA